MEDFFYRGPVLAGFSCCERSLERVGICPPCFSYFVRHFFHVSFEIISDVFKVAEEEVIIFFDLAKIDGVISDVTFFDAFEYA